MKTVLMIVIVIVILAFIGLATFILTFNVDRYRPHLVHKLEEIVGSPVKIEKLSLGWNGGLALEMKGLIIYPEKVAYGEPAIQLDKASAVVRLMPLFRKSIEVGSITLVRPRLNVTRAANGRVKVEGFNPPEPSKSKKPSAGIQTFKPLALFISVIKVEDGEVRFEDHSQESSIKIIISHIDLTLRNVSFARPIDIQMRMALFSEKQNINLSAKLRLPLQNQPVVLEGVRLETDFNRWQAVDLISVFPELQGLNSQEGLLGKLALDVNRLAFDSHGISELEAKFKLDDGALSLVGFQGPIENLNLEASLHKDQLELSRFAAHLGGGAMTASGTVGNLTLHPKTSLRVTLEQLVLDHILPPSGPDEPQLHGQLSAAFEGAAIGKSWPEINQTLLGQGQVTLKSGVVTNLNVPREIFRQLSIIPGLVERLQARLPASYQAKLEERDTVLEPVDLPVNVNNGAIFFNDLKLVSGTFELNGKGRVGLDGMLDLQTIVRIDSDLSEAIIRSIQELQYLRNTAGQLELPVRIKGALHHVIVLPDVQYVATRLVVNKAEEVVGNLLQKALTKKSAAGTSNT